VTNCRSCGQPNEDGSLYCMACGRPMADAQAPRVVSETYVPSQPTSPRRPGIRPNLHLLLPTLLVVAFVLGVVSLGTAWWSYDGSASGKTESLNFVPGSSYYVTCSGTGCGGFSAGTFPYTVLGGSVGGMYITVLSLMIVAVVLTGLVALFAVLGALGRGSIRMQSTTVLILKGTAILILFATLIWTATGQSSTFPPGQLFAGTGSTGASPDTSFWGSASTPGASAAWGAGPGWYLALTTVVLLCGVLVLLPWVGRRREAGARAHVAPARIAPMTSSVSSPPP
jgi:hypothetical protein